MTPKEKAKELYDKYESYMRFEDKIVIKECALIAINEILKEYIILKLNTFYCEIDFKLCCENYDFWGKVEKEIENL